MHALIIGAGMGGLFTVLAGAVENPTKWGLYDRDAFEHWQHTPGDNYGCY